MLLLEPIVLIEVDEVHWSEEVDIGIEVSLLLDDLDVESMVEVRIRDPTREASELSVW